MENIFTKYIFNFNFSLFYMIIFFSILISSNFNDNNLALWTQKIKMKILASIINTVDYFLLIQYSSLKWDNFSMSVISSQVDLSNSKKRANKFSKGKNWKMIEKKDFEEQLIKLKGIIGVQLKLVKDLTAQRDR